MKVENLIDKITFNKNTEQSINNQTNQINPLAMLDNVVWEKEINKIKIEKLWNWYRAILTYNWKTYDYLEMIKDYLNSSELNLLNRNSLSVLTWEQVLENSADDKDYTEIKIHKISKSILEWFKDDIGEFNKWERQYFWFAKSWYLQILIDLKTWQFVVWTNWTWKRIETTLFNITDKYWLYASQKSIWDYRYIFNLIDLSKWFNNNKQPTKFPIWYNFSHSQINWYFSNRTWWNNNIWNNKEFFEINWIIYVVKVDKDNTNVVSNITVEEEVKWVESLWNVWKDEKSQLFIYKSITKNKVFIINKSLWIKKDISSWFDNIEKYSITTIWDKYNLIDTQNKTINIFIKNHRNNERIRDFILINYETLKIVKKITNIPDYDDCTIKYSGYVLWIVKEENWNLVYVQKNNWKYLLNIIINWQKAFGENWYDMSEVLNNKLRKYHFSYYDYYWFYKKFNILFIEPHIDYQKELYYILKIKDEVKFLKDVKFIDRQENKFIIRYENKEDVYSYIWFSLDKNWKVKIKEKTLDLTKDKDKIQLMETREWNDYFYMKEWLAKIIKSEDLYN